MPAPMAPPISVPGTAQHHHQQRIHRGGQYDVFGADEAVRVRPQHAREPAESARDDERDVFVQPGVVSEDAHAKLVLADADEAPPERRPDQEVQRRSDAAKKPNTTIEESHVVGEVDAEAGPGGRMIPLSPPVSEFHR